MPLAVVANVDTATPNLYFVHADHLDRPVTMIDSTAAIVWEAVYRPFCEVQSISGTASNNLRFPGQYFLTEDGLHYNWHRHYDPMLGRYIQPDPIRDVMALLPADLVGSTLIATGEIYSDPEAAEELAESFVVVGAFGWTMLQTRAERCSIFIAVR